MKEYNIYNIFDFSDALDPYSEYMKVHTVLKNKLLHVYWNYFRPPYVHKGLRFFNHLDSYSIVIYFGKGEYVISIHKKFKDW